MILYNILNSLQIAEWVASYAFLFKNFLRHKIGMNKNHNFGFINSPCMHYSNCSSKQSYEASAFIDILLMKLGLREVKLLP